MEIKRSIQSYKTVGFECDMCLKPYRTDEYSGDEKWPCSNKGSLNMFRNRNFDDPLEPAKDEFVDLCETCFQKLLSVVRSYGGRIQTLD